MNALCPLNDSEHPYENRNLTSEIPPQNYIGTNKHYFSEPTEEYQKKMDNGEFFDINGYLKRRDGYYRYNMNLLSSSSKLRESKKKKDASDLMRPSISSEWVQKSARIIEKENINLYQVLSDYDLNGNGYITLKDLILGLARVKIIFTEEDKESLKKYLKMSGFTEDKISVKAFAQNFGKTSTYFDPYNHNKNEINVQTSSNGFKKALFDNTNLNIKNFNNDNYFNSSIQRSLTYM